MEIEFTLTREDYTEFLRTAYARMARMGKGKTKFFALNLVAWVLFGIAATGVFRFNGIHDGMDFLHLNLALLFLGLGLVWLFVITPYQRQVFVRHTIDEHGHILKPQMAGITEEAIGISTFVSTHAYAWSAIQGKAYSGKLA